MIAPEYKLQPVKTLTPYERNARTHSPAQVERIAKSIAAFGFTNPVLVDEDGQIIAGHGRLMAAKKLKLQEVPTLVLAGLDALQKRALVLADNKLALDAGWDMELLRGELLELEKAPGFDLELSGFTLDEATAMFEFTGDRGQALDAPEPAPKDPLLEKCRELLKGDPGFAAVVNARHEKMVRA